jgi:hypothetical protein
LGGNRRDALRSCARRIIEHLLLLEYSRAQEARRGWSEEILNFRSQIDERLSARLRRDLRRQLPRLYQRARGDAQKRLELYGEIDASAPLPGHCPYTLDQVPGDFWPALVTDWGRQDRTT